MLRRPKLSNEVLQIRMVRDGAHIVKTNFPVITVTF